MNSPRHDDGIHPQLVDTNRGNAVIAYNTWKLHQMLERSREAGRPVPGAEILAHIAPIAFRHINFQGKSWPPERNELSRGNRYFWQVSEMRCRALSQSGGSRKSTSGSGSSRFIGVLHWTRDGSML